VIPVTPKFAVANTLKHSQSREFPVRTICAGTRMQRVQNSGLNLWVDGTVKGAWGQESYNIR